MKMENRNQCNSPRDRIDDTLLIRLLNEEEPFPEYTCTGERRNPNSGGEASRRSRCRSHSGCTHPPMPEPRRESTGCGGTAPNVRPGNNCGCGDSTPYVRPADDCGCDQNCSAGGYLTGYALAMVYVPDHDFDTLFEEEEALLHGTLFRPLELPFYPGCGGRCGCREGGSR